MDQESNPLEIPGKGEGLGACYRLILSLKKKRALAQVETDLPIHQDEPKEETDEHN